MPVSESDQRATERWFYRRGLPQFVLDYRSDTDVWTRAAPFLFVTFLVLFFGSAGDIRGTTGAVLLLASAAVALAAYAVANVRGGRRFYALPTHVGRAVLVGYVVVPALLSAVASRQLLPPIVTAGEALALLALAWLVTWAALLPLVGWAARWTLSRVERLLPTVTRALPLLLVFVTIIFLTTEVWQVAGTLPAPWLWASVGLFVALAVAFALVRVPGEIAGLEELRDRDDIVAACRRTPVADLAVTLPDLGEPLPLTRAQRWNAGYAMTMAQVVQVGLFALVVWVFFSVFSVIAISVPVQSMWLGGLEPVTVLWQLSPTHALTQEALRVSTFVAGFSALYVTVYSASDAAYREHFFDDIRASLRRAMAVRQVYVAALRGGT